MVSCVNGRFSVGGDKTKPGSRVHRARYVAERLPLVSEVRANFCRWKVSRQYCLFYGPDTFPFT
jgi:hypothetical protein